MPAIKLGASSISKVLIGSVPVSRIMLGLQQIWTARKITSLALFGDSITDQNSTVATSNPNGVLEQSLGYAVNALFLLEHPFDLVERTTSAYVDNGDRDFGYGSYSAQQLIDGNRSGDGVYPLTDLANADPDDVFVFAGSNPDTDTVGALVELWDTFTAAGRRVFAAEILPRGENASGYDGTELANCYTYNVLLKAAAQSRGIPFLEWADAIALGPGDFADESLLNASDHVHPNRRGAELLGARFAAFIEPFCGAAYSLPVDGDAAWVTINPYVAGDSSGLATGFTKTNPAGGTTTASKISDGDGTVWQRLVISQPGTYNAVTYRQSSGTSGTFAVGDIVRPVCRVRGDASGWDIKAFHIIIYDKVATVTTARNSGMYDYATSLSSKPTLEVADGLILGPPYTIKADTTDIYTYFQAWGSATIDIRQIGLIKVG